MQNERRPIEYTYHARQRMKSRRISEADVERIIRSGARRPDGLDKWKANGWAEDGRWIEVVYVETENGAIEILLVVTVIDKEKGW